jgi:hypothetical protein
MTVPYIHSGAAPGLAHHSPATGFREPLRPWTPGQEVTVTVHRQLGSQYYLAQVGNRTGQIVTSSVPLPAGAPLRAVVIAVGARLELKLLNPENGGMTPLSDPEPDTDDSKDSDSDNPSSLEAVDAAIASQIDALSTRYQVPLTNHDHGVIATAMKAVSVPRNMALGGLYLAKLGLTLNPNSMQALYEAQSPSAGSSSDAAAAMELSTLVPNLTPPVQSGLNALIERMDSTLNGPTSATPPVDAAPLNSLLPDSTTDSNRGDHGSQGHTHSKSDSDLARELLNVPLGASVVRHYGTVPVLVSGQLLELQLVAFQHRETPQEPNPVRRLFMTLTTPALGRLQIAAQAQGNRLSVTFTVESAHATETLSSHASQVRELVGRLGWQVDSVVYGIGQPSGAAQTAITHALLDSTMDQLL